MSLPIDSVLSGVSAESETGHLDPSKSSQTITDNNESNRVEVDEARVAGLPSSFCAEHAPSAERYAMSIIRRWADAEEVVQEAFCRLIESGLRGKPALFSIVRNLAIDRLRKYGRRNFETLDANEIANSKTTNQKQQLEQLQQLEQGVEEAMLEMPNHWADALRLKINGDLSYEEISNVLEVTHAQVRTWIFRARKQLEKDLVQRGLLEG